MNFLSEVLLAAEKTEMDTIKSKIPEVSAEISTLKNETWNLIDNVYVRIRERPLKNNILSQKTSRLCEELSVFQETLENHLKKDIVNANNELKILETELKDAKKALSATSKLVYIHNNLASVENLRRNGNFVEAAEVILRILSDICTLEVEEEIKKATDKIKSKVDSEMALLLENLNTEVIEKNLVFNKVVNDIHNKFTIKVNKNNYLLKEAFNALLILDKSTFLLPLFIVKEMFHSLYKNSALVEIQEDSANYTLEVTVIEKKDNSNYKETFSTFLKIFQFLHFNLNSSLGDEHKLYNHIVKMLKSSFIDSIMKFCILSTIPSTEADLKNFDVVFEEITNFENELRRLSVLEQDESPFTNYVKNVDKLFIDHKCQEYTEKAIILMKKDLHEMVEIGSEPSLENTELFSKCCVSKSVLELIEMIKSMLQKAFESPENISKTLIAAVQNIFDMYASEVSENHQKMLQAIPQQVALFKNNCYFLAYQIENLKSEYAGKNTIISLFNINSHQLRIYGTDLFQNFVQNQVKLIEEIVENSDFSQLQTLQDSNKNDLEKTIRQCLRQQELLRTVWHKVLTANDYNETMGIILNFFCNKLITSVLSVEDLSSEIAEQLVESFKLVQSRGPKLFTDIREVNMRVEVWYKFNEVVFILNASMTEICDRWADGKGPLGLVLKPEEVKRMIRALFQNTERRAVLLAKIS